MSSQQTYFHICADRAAYFLTISCGDMKCGGWLRGVKRLVSRSFWAKNMLLSRPTLYLQAKKKQGTGKNLLSNKILQSVESGSLFSYPRWLSGIFPAYFLWRETCHAMGDSGEWNGQLAGRSLCKHMHLFCTAKWMHECAAFFNWLRNLSRAQLQREARCCQASLILKLRRLDWGFVKWQKNTCL